MKNKNKKWLARTITTLVVILIGVASWGFYNIINTGVEDILLKVGVENIYMQNITVVIIAVLILALMGTGVSKAVNSIIGG